MNTFELVGTLIETLPTQTFSKGFRKREFVVEYGDKYPQKICLQLVQEKCEIIDAFGIGDEVTVSFNIKGRDWTDKSGQVKYFTSLEAWKISGKKVGGNKQSAIEEDEFDKEFGLTNTPQKASTATSVEWSNDDLPF
jgi:hypothetical protein